MAFRDEIIRNDESNEDMFAGCDSLVDITKISISTTASYSCYYMFRNCTSLTTIPSNLLNATTLADRCYENMFEGCTSLINLDGLMNWNFSRTDKMDAMFSGCTGLRSLRGLNMKNNPYSEVNIQNLANTDEMAKWYKYIYSGIIYNIYDNIPNNNWYRKYNISNICKNF